MLLNIKKLLLCASLLSGNAMAYTECQVVLTRVYTGDDGFSWLFFENNGSARLTPDDPDTPNLFALATIALIKAKPLIVRYTADGVPCSSAERLDLRGAYLLR